MWVCMHVCRYEVLASRRDHHAVLSVCDAWIAMHRLSAGVRRSDNGAPHRPSSFEQHDAQADSQGQVGMAKPLGAKAPGAGFDETDVQRPPGCDVDGMPLDEDRVFRADPPRGGCRIRGVLPALILPRWEDLAA
jgi:hypothetical protein